MPTKRNVPKSQDSQWLVFLVATFYLVVPFLVLLAIARRAEPAEASLVTSLPVEDYHRALLQAEQPEIAPVSRSLVSVESGANAKPVTVVTWTRGVIAFNDRTPNYKDTWVTVSPHVQNFCRSFMRQNGADLSKLALRLEQRLGLPPNSNYDTFVELRIDPRMPQFFRPCKNPSPTGNSCDPAKSRTALELRDDFRATDPQKRREVQNRYWFLNTFYNSFASKNQYPWTSLGYTFDWARKGNSNEFEKFGESEFIVAADTPVKFLSAASTASYCAP